MTHGSIPESNRQRRGLDERLIRLSVGLEDEDDLITDLKTALRAASADQTAGLSSEKMRVGDR